MVVQGHIIKLNINPQCGHEQAGFRPAVVISNEIYHKKTNLAVVCPITNTMRKFPLQISSYKYYRNDFVSARESFRHSNTFLSNDRAITRGFIGESYFYCAVTN